MSNVKVSALPAAAALDGSELVPVVQGGATVRTTAQAVADLAGGGTLTLIPHDSTTGWTSTSGALSVTDGVLAQGGSGDAVARYDGLLIPAQATIEMQVRFDSFVNANAQAGFMVGPLSGSPNGSPSASIFTGPGDGTSPTLNVVRWFVGGGGSFPIPGPLATGQWYTLKATRVGSTLDAYFDGTYIGTASLPADLGTARLGLLAYNATARYRNLSVLVP